MKDLRPIIERNETNGLCQAEAVRDRVYELFVKESAAQGVDLLILKSPPFTAPPWVSVECWVHHASYPSLTLRSSAVLAVRSREFHRFPIEIDLTLRNDKRNRTTRSIVSFEQSEANEVLRYLLSEDKSPSFRFNRCRAWPLQFWLPVNKPARLGVDASAVLMQVLLTIGVVTLSFGIGALFLLFAGAIAYNNSKRRRHVLSAGKPAQEPRRLIRLDSWQTLVRELGTEKEAYKVALKEELQKDTKDDFLMADESIWYWGVDGKEERQQLVIRFRRGMAFIHIYPYGNDLFVGWDAHVNCGTWIEQIAGGGYDKSAQELCSVHTITAGWHVPNEYDITDTNCLLERVHAAVTKVLKRKLAEHKIDQEIDFKILREQRQGVAGRQDSDGGAVRSVISRIRRVG